MPKHLHFPGLEDLAYHPEHLSFNKDLFFHLVQAPNSFL